MIANNLVRNDGLLTDSAGHIFVPANPPHLRARLLVIAHAGSAGHRGLEGEVRLAKFVGEGKRICASSVSVVF